MVFNQVSLVIPSSNPKLLSNFYASLLNNSASRGYTKNDFYLSCGNALALRIFKPSANSKLLTQKSKSISICFEGSPSSDPLTEMSKWIDHLLKMGAKVVEKPKVETFGAEAWLSDIEDNKFLILIPFVKHSKN